MLLKVHTLQLEVLDLIMYHVGSDDLATVLQNNKKWVESEKAKDPKYFGNTPLQAFLR